MVKEDEEEELIILVGENCPPCEEVEETLKNSASTVKYTVVDVTSDKGREILAEGDLKTVELPFAVRIKKTVKQYDIFVDKEEKVVLVKDEQDQVKPISEAECPECSEAIATAWTLISAQRMGMPKAKINDLRQKVVDGELEPDQVIDQVLDIAKNKKNDEEIEMLHEIRRLMKTPLSEL